MKTYTFWVTLEGKKIAIDRALGEARLEIC